MGAASPLGSCYNLHLQDYLCDTLVIPWSIRFIRLDHESGGSGGVALNRDSFDCRACFGDAKLLETVSGPVQFADT